MEYPTKEQLYNNLELCYRRALECPESIQDSKWYFNQSGWIREVINSVHRITDAGKIPPTSFVRAYAVTAALSPQVSWASQRKFIPGVLSMLTNVDAKNITAEALRHPGFLINKEKAVAIWTAPTVSEGLEHLKGLKVTSFFKNLSGSSSFVTIDSQMQDIACCCSPTERPILTSRRYRELEEMIQSLAAATLEGGWYSPMECQAILWSYHRRHNRGRVD